MENTMQTMAPQKAGAQLLVRPRTLTIDDLTEVLKELPIPVKVQDGFLVLETSLRGWTFKEPVKVPLEQVLAVREKGLVPYILRAFGSERPKLIPWTFENESIVKLARHFLRGFSGSPMTLYTYADTISRYSLFLNGHSPDMIIHDAKAGGNIADEVRVKQHIGFVEDYRAQLEDDGLTKGRVHCCVKHLRTFYRIHGINIELEEPPKRGQVTYKDRAPTPDELTRILELASLRDKVLITLGALGGFRESTISMLTYGHVREDAEKGAGLIHIHVPAEITKGKYHDYDTFLGAEGTEYLRLYINLRKNGFPDRRLPPEELTDKSPLVRDETVHAVKAIAPKQIRRTANHLFLKAGVVSKPKGRMYEVRFHSLRKFFKTQMLAAGVQESYVDYFMGHTIDTYHDIQSLGIEKLRTIYAKASLSIRPKTKAAKIEQLKDLMRAMDEQIRVLSREASTEPARVHVDGQSTSQQLQVRQLLASALRDLLQQEEASQGLTSQNSTK